MRLYSSQTAILINKIKSGTIRGVLLHGPDRGYVMHICGQLIKNLDLLPCTYSSSDISSGILGSLLNNRNFFGQRELIKIMDATSSIDKDTKNVLSSNFHNLVCFIANESLSPSGIRKFFESEEHLASIGCYYSNEQEIGNLIAAACRQSAKTIEDEALLYLKKHLSGDYQSIKNELIKLLHFVHDENKITLQHVEAVIATDINASGDEMCLLFAEQNYKEFLEEVSKLKDQGINEVLMIRALLRFNFNLYIVTSYIEECGDINKAIAKLPAPIFFKYVDRFKKLAQKYSSKQVLLHISRLQKAEADFKLNPRCFDIFSYA